MHHADLISQYNAFKTHLWRSDIGIIFKISITIKVLLLELINAGNLPVNHLEY